MIDIVFAVVEGNRERVREEYIEGSCNIKRVRSEKDSKDRAKRV